MWMARRYRRSAAAASPCSASSMARFAWPSGRSATSSCAARYSSRAAASVARSASGSASGGTVASAARGVDPHGAHRVVEQRKQQACPCRGLDAVQRADGRHAHERIGVVQRALDGRPRGRGKVGLQQRHRRGADDGGLCRIVATRRQSRAGPGKVLAPGVDRLGPVRPAGSRGPPPSGRRVGGPLRRLLRVAVGAGVRRAELHRQVGTRHAEAVVVARVDHHVGRAPACGRRRSAAPAEPLGMVSGAPVSRTSPAAWQRGTHAGRRDAAQLACCADRGSRVQVTPAAYIRLCRNEPYS